MDWFVNVLSPFREKADSLKEKSSAQWSQAKDTAVRARDTAKETAGRARDTAINLSSLRAAEMKEHDNDACSVKLE